MKGRGRSNRQYKTRPKTKNSKTQFPINQLCTFKGEILQNFPFKCTQLVNDYWYMISLHELTHQIEFQSLFWLASWFMSISQHVREQWAVPLNQDNYHSLFCT